jgi:hypothetical protein
MFPFPIARPQGCDIQTFYRSPNASGSRGARTWNKPRGVSHVYMLLIGAGGGGRLTGGGGGSGGVTVWYGAAQHVPDVLTVIVGVGGSATQGGDSLVKLMTNQTLLAVNGGDAAGASGGAGAGAAASTAASSFAAMGFFQAVAGQAGGALGGAATTSTTTFLSGGSGGAGSANNAGYDNTANYGYVAKGGAAVAGVNDDGKEGNTGTFQMQPIIFGTGGGGGGSSGANNGNGGTGGKGGIGCGGGGAGVYINSASDSIGGDGLVLIASW